MLTLLEIKLYLQIFKLTKVKKCGSCVKTMQSHVLNSVHGGLTFSKSVLMLATLVPDIQIRQFFKYNYI